MATPAVALINSTETFGNPQTPTAPRLGFTNTGAPTVGIWYTGDRLENLAWAGTTVSPHAYVCIAGGIPGTWKACSKA
jgi:hypothetical protein